MSARHLSTVAHHGATSPTDGSRRDQSTISRGTGRRLDTLSCRSVRYMPRSPITLTTAPFWIPSTLWRSDDQKGAVFTRPLLLARVRMTYGLPSLWVRCSASHTRNVSSTRAPTARSGRETGLDGIGGIWRRLAGGW